VIFLDALAAIVGLLLLVIEVMLMLTMIMAPPSSVSMSHDAAIVAGVG